MRISDWSSDVCSSDLLIRVPRSVTKASFTAMQAIVSMPLALSPSAFCAKPGRCLAEQVGLGQLNVVRIGCDFVNDNRSEERRVGKECVSTCRSRWSPYH